MPLLPEFARLRLDDGHARMIAEFFAELDLWAMLPGLRELADPGPRRAAERIAAQMRALPAIDDAPAALEALLS